MVGRGLRPAPNKKDLVIIDHGDNVLRHGWYDIERDWSLTEKKKKTDKQNAFPVRLCESCEAMMPVSTSICPECGHQKEQKIITPVFAEFAELVKPKVPEHLRKRWRDMDIDELREFARFKGYKEGWVRAQLNLRK
jgi:superfamily II DNA or RNA helicase